MGATHCPWKAQAGCSARPCSEGRSGVPRFLTHTGTQGLLNVAPHKGELLTRCQRRSLTTACWGSEGLTLDLLLSPRPRAWGSWVDGPLGPARLAFSGPVACDDGSLRCGETASLRHHVPQARCLSSGT